MDEDVAAAKKSVEKFSELLRYQLYDHQPDRTCKLCEIHYLRNFIQLATGPKLGETPNWRPISTKRRMVSRHIPAASFPWLRTPSNT